MGQYIFRRRSASLIARKAASLIKSIHELNAMSAAMATTMPTKSKGGIINALEKKLNDSSWTVVVVGVVADVVITTTACNTTSL